MKLISFSFKREAIWMLIFPLASLLIAVLVYLTKKLAFLISGESAIEITNVYWHH